MSQLNLEEVVCLKSQQKLHREVVFSCVPQLAEFLIFYHRPRSSILHPAAISDHVPPQRAYAFPIFLSISPGYVYVAPTRDTYLNLLRLLHFLNLPHFDQNIPYTWFTCYICWRQIVTIAKIYTYFQGRQILGVLNCRDNRVLINDHYYYDYYYYCLL